MQLSRSLSFASKYSTAARSFSSGKGSLPQGGNYDGISSNNMTSNSPNYGTSNQSGGSFSGSANRSSNQNISGASNQTSPSSASKATSTSGTTQAPGSATSSFSNSATPKTANSSDAIPETKSNDKTAVGGGFASFLKNAFSGVKTDGPMSNDNTESSNRNQPSIPKNTSTFTAGINQGVTGNPKERSSGSYGNPASEAANTTPVNPNEGDAKIVATKGEDSAAEYDDDEHSEIAAQDYERARTELQFNNVNIRYAYLLWSTYKANNSLDVLEEDIVELYECMEHYPSLQIVFDTDELTTETNREEALDEFLNEIEDLDDNIVGRINELMEAFLRTVRDSRRIKDLTEIFRAVPIIRDRIENNVRTATVASAEPLTEAEKESIKDTIQKTFSPDGPVEIIEEIKPELGGGYEIFYDGEYHLDNSQKNLLAELDDEIQQTIDSHVTKSTSNAESAH